MKWPLLRYRIEGDSMHPTFQSGDRVFVWRWGNIRAGDVVVFSRGGMTMVKRAAKKNGDRWTMRGDNLSASSDSLDFGDVSEKDVIGKIVATY